MKKGEQANKKYAEQRAKECRQALFDKISRFGAMTTEDFMAHCLTDKRFGYYRNAQLGQDFITAPMISKKFGKAIGQWVVQSWKRLQRPRKLMLIEAGAGRGELLYDILSCMQETCRELLPCLFVQIVEVNQNFRLRQARVLARFNLRGCAWCENLEEVNEEIWIFVANEFFDALPTRQYVLQQLPANACQSFVRRVAISNDPEDEKNTLRFVRGEPRPLPPSLLGAFGGKEKQQLIVEISPRTLALTTHLAQVMARFGGTAFICDYGYTTHQQAKKHGSLQAFFRHKVVSPLAHIGTCDLSAEVDFASMAKEFSILDECSISTQKDFLHNAKIFDQPTNSNNSNEDIAEAKAAQRLLATDAMGERFKVLTAFSNTPIINRP